MMRMVMFAVAVAALTACDQAADDAPNVEVKPAALTFDGGDYKDQASKVAHGKRLAIVLSCTGCTGTIYRARTSAPTILIMAT